MKIRGRNIPGIEITLDNEDAAELRHILNLFSIKSITGEFGSGTSVDKQIRLCNDLADGIKERLN